MKAKPKPSKIKLIAGIILSILLLVFSLFAFKQSIADSMLVVQSKHWDTATGEITAGNISQYYGRYLSGYHIDFEYRFVVEGKTYTGDNFTIPRRGYSGQIPSQQIFALHPVGSTTTVYFDPQNPQHSSIQDPSSSLSFAIVRMLAMLLLVAFSVFLLSRVIKNRGK